MSQTNDQILRGVYTCDGCHLEFPVTFQGDGTLCSRCRPPSMGRHISKKPEKTDT